MADVALENALSRRRELEEKIAAAQERIKEWRAEAERASRFIHDWEEFSGQVAPTQERPGAPKKVGIVKRTNPPSAKPKNPKKEEVAAAARKILLRNGVPLGRDDLFEAVTKEGIVIHGKNPPVVFQTMLWRMQDVIVNIKGYGYWPADLAFGPADYDPEEDVDLSAELGEEAESLI